MATTERLVITPEQYTARLAPVSPPSSEELFEFERALLAEKGLAPIELFDRFAGRLPASGLFVLIPPQPAPASKLDWSDLMARVELDGKAGQNHLNPKYLKDEIEVPDAPTMLVGVGDGRARLNILPMDSRSAIVREGRHAYHLWRGYIHVFLFPHVLKHHGLDIVGSRCKSDYVPVFYLRGEGPALSSHWEGYAHPEWGAPSCGSVES